MASSTLNSTWCGSRLRGLGGDNGSTCRPQGIGFRSRRLGFRSVVASGDESERMEPDLSVRVNGLDMPNPFVIASGPPGTNYTVMKRAFDEGWGAVIAKTVKFFMHSCFDFLSLLINFASLLCFLFISDSPV